MIWRDLRHTSDPRSYYTLLRTELDALADSLAKTIDTRHAAQAPKVPEQVAAANVSRLAGLAAIYTW